MSLGWRPWLFRAGCSPSTLSSNSLSYPMKYMVRGIPSRSTDLRDMSVLGAVSLTVLYLECSTIRSIAALRRSGLVPRAVRAACEQSRVELGNQSTWGNFTRSQVSPLLPISLENMDLPNMQVGSIGRVSIVLFWGMPCPLLERANLISCSPAAQFSHSRP